MERLSVSLDEKSMEFIKKFTVKYNTSKADIIRRALLCLNEMEEITKFTTIEDIKIYIDYLANMEHIILDIAHWESVFPEIGDGSDKFWDDVYKIGESHRKEYHDKGLRDIKRILIS